MIINSELYQTSHKQSICKDKLLYRERQRNDNLQAKLKLQKTKNRNKETQNKLLKKKNDEYEAMTGIKMKKNKTQNRQDYVGIRQQQRREKEMNLTSNTVYNGNKKGENKRMRKRAREDAGLLDSVIDDNYEHVAQQVTIRTKTEFDNDKYLRNSSSILAQMDQLRQKWKR